MRIDKETAKSQGIFRYDPDGPCINGHYAQRWTYNDACVVCARTNGSEERPEVKANERSKLRRYKLLGIKQFTTRIHPDDLPLVNHLIKTLNDARERKRFGDIRPFDKVHKCRRK